MKKSLLATAGVLSAAALVLSACSSDSGGTDGPPTVVASTNVWGSVAAAVAGDNAEVTALYTNADGDPHEFEPSAADTATIADADILVFNGGHYDSYMEEAAANSDATAVDAYALLGSDEHADEAGGEHADHGDEHASGDHSDGAHDHAHGDQNEHVFYDLPVVAQVADKVADALAEKDPGNAESYRANAETFTTGIDGLRAKLTTIREQHADTEVAQTEPLAGYMLTEAGLVDIAPAGFTQAVEEGQSPAAADRAALQDILADRRAWPVSPGPRPGCCRSAPSPDGVTDYVVWQGAQIDALTAALGSGSN